MRELALSLNASILGRARAGDLAAFEELMLQHERMVLMTALRVLGSREDAQDAAQQVFLRLHKYLHQFRGDASAEQVFTSWLYRMTINVCRDMQRQQKIGRASVPLEEVRLVSLEQGPEEVLRAEEKRNILLQALAELPEKEKSAVVLRDIQGLSTREVAGIMGTTEATVRSQVSEARWKMKKFADRYLKRRL